jgi:hypothetical protein
MLLTVTAAAPFASGNLKGPTVKAAAQGSATTADLRDLRRA